MTGRNRGRGSRGERARGRPRRGRSAGETMSTLRAVRELREEIEEQRRVQREARAERARRRGGELVSALLPLGEGTYSPGGSDSESEFVEAAAAPSRRVGEDLTRRNIHRIY